MRVAVACVVGSLVVGVGCVEEPPVDGTLDQRVEIPAPPELGEQLVGPDVVIPAGTDKMICWVSTWVPDQDYLVERFDSFQGASGHHLAGYKSVVPREAGEVFDCSDEGQMTTLKPLIFPRTPNSEGTSELLPDGMVVRIPANTQLIMQSHYVNANTEDIRVRDVANFNFVPAGVERIEANYMFLNTTNFVIPPDGQHHSTSASCTLPSSFQFASVIGHMHEWGKTISIEHVAAAADPTTVYEIESWNSTYRDQPPVTRFTLDAPLSIAGGDDIRVNCDWVNDGDEDLTFPAEMCVAIFVYYPALPEGLIDCTE